VEVNIDGNRLGESVKMTLEDFDETSKSNEALANFFPTIRLGTLREPAIIIDIHGQILIWYLPGIMMHRLVCV
jgi:hypothetical protein